MSASLLGDMKILRSFLFILVMIFGLGLSVSAHALEPMGNCPVMPGHAAKEKFFVDYQGKRIHLCCRSCVKAFKKHPERYLKNLPENTFTS